MNKKASQGDTDLFSVDDGAQTDPTEQAITSPQNGDGQGANPKPGNTGYRTTPDGQQNHYNEHIETPDAPFNEDVVDENHANNAATILFDKFIKIADNGDDQNNFLRNTIDIQDIVDKHGNIPEEELVGQQNQIVQNNVPHGFSGADNSILNNPKAVTDKDQSDDKLDDLAPRNYPNASLCYEKFIKTAEKDYSFLQKLIKPDEVEETAEKKKQDFGTGDCSSDTTTMAVAPLEGNLVTDESSNYSGFSKESSYFFTKMIKSDYTQVVPSANPESGAEESNAQPGQADNGKRDSDHESDKLFNDPNKYRKNLKYDDRVEDTDDYFKFLPSGGEFGMEGDGEHSGVSN